MKKLKKAWMIIRETGSAFSEDNAFKLSASLSYYTLFALGPVLIIIISLAGIFLGRDAVEGRLYGEMKNLLGDEASIQIQQIIANHHHSHSSTTGAIIGFVILLIGATGVFTEMQGSINFIWSVKARPEKSWLKYLINRLLSFLLVLGLGFVLIVSLITNTILTLMSDKLMRFFHNYTIYLFNLVNTAIILVVITMLFAIIFKVLPDARIKWKDAIIGSAVTAVLFLIGKFLIGYYIERAKLDITYGTAAAIIVILTWVYYTALILYFGAEFTKIYAIHAGSGIKPKDTAVFIIKKESKEITSSSLL
ncbi:MAG: ribonuclease BN [Chitinophagaceae bacterium]